MATFAGCEITGKIGATYTLTAAASGFTTITSNAFSITIGGASQLAFSAQAGGGVDGTAWGTQPAVTVQDVGGNTVTTATNSIALAITTQPGTGATLACTGGNSLAATNGVATFAGCKITGKTGSYTISASASGLATATGTPFSITIGGATQLVFTDPARRRGQRLGLDHPARGQRRGRRRQHGHHGHQLDHPRHRHRQPGGARSPAPPTRWAPPTGWPASPAARSPATTPGAYTLTAAATGFTTITSSPFTVYGTATQLVFTVQPCIERRSRQPLDGPAGGLVEDRPGRRRRQLGGFDHPRHRKPARLRGHLDLHRRQPAHRHQRGGLLRRLRDDGGIRQHWHLHHQGHRNRH